MENTVEGLVYLLNQAGIALAQANARIAQLAAENQALREGASHGESGK